MGPREEDNSALLLGAVAFICALIAFAAGLLEPTTALAGRSADAANHATFKASEPVTTAPARIIVPFTPNTTPSAR